MTDIHALRSVVVEAGLSVMSGLEFSHWHPQQPLKADIDAWVINLNIEKLETQCPEKIDALMDAIPGVMILCEGGSPPNPAEPGYPSWKRRMMEKFRSVAGDIALANHAGDVPSCVWVLAGSVGGPAAIHRFLEALPPDMGMAFVYANHLQKDFEQVLADAMAQNTNYPAYVARHGDVLAVNKVAIISPEFLTTLMPNGTVQVSKQRWPGAYQPNLDYVVSNVAGTFGHTGGVIIFSGMCDDGAASCRIMKQNGGRVWVQRQDTCVSSAMPDAALATGCVEKIGTPEQLANELVFWANECKRQARAR
jgi:chemosensory pili system protein ChpB (putative protein-glutamate methylesterase)